MLVVSNTLYIFYRIFNIGVVVVFFFIIDNITILLVSLETAAVSDDPRRHFDIINFDPVNVPFKLMQFNIVGKIREG